MGHDHHHDHGHHHHARHSEDELAFPRKLEKLLDHWIRHNEDHAQSYRQWAERCREQKLEALAASLEHIAAMNLEINQQMAAARKLIPAE